MAVKDKERRDLIAGKLRGYRATAQLSQEQVGTACGMEKSAIGRYEQGSSEIGLETAWDLADLYGVSLDELGGREWPPKEVA